MTSLFLQSEQLQRVSDHWCLTRDGDPYAYDLTRRHYSTRRYRQPRMRQFVGPGRKLVLLSTDGKAVFVWRQFIDDALPKQTGYNCAVFRNEGEVQSSVLIREAVAIVLGRWGPGRCYTYVDARRIRSSNPGCCFKKAGWRCCGKTKGGKLIFELLLNHQYNQSYE